MTSIQSSEFTLSKDPVHLQVTSGGRVVVLQKVFYNPTNHQWFDIKITRTGFLPWLKSWVGAGGYQAAQNSDDVAKQIVKTYEVVLKALHVSPEEGGRLMCDETKTCYRSPTRSVTSYSYQKGRHDILLSKEDAALFGESNMTVHDAIRVGILQTLGLQGMSSISEKHPEGELNDQQAGNSNPKSQKTFSAWPKLPKYKEKNTPFDSGYDNFTSTERRDRMIQHLDQSLPVPFSAFVNGNQQGKIDPIFFSQMLNGLRTLAIDPTSGKGKAKYMRELLQQWFRAAYHYLDKNSKPGDGYALLEAEELKKCKNIKKAEAQARAKAKEAYWRKYATEFWMTMIALFAKEKIDIDKLQDTISKTSR